MKIQILLFALTVSWNTRIIRTEYSNGIVSFVIPPSDSIEIGRVKRDAANPGTIEQMHITTNVSNRFARTTISSRVKNDQAGAAEVTFSAVLPVNAFISRFWMEIGGTTYEAEIQEKNNASRIYNEAVSEGRTAGHVELSVRNSNRFTVSVNVESEKKVNFYLRYEELLMRKKNKYEVVVNIYPESVVNDLEVVVGINETMPLLFVGTPLLRSENDVLEYPDLLDDAFIKVTDTNAAQVTFTLDSWKQRQIRNLNREDKMGTEFTVQYDVVRNPQGESVLIAEEHFVQFFAPTLSTPLPKQVIFVLDTSGSMEGSKLENLKEAMRNILKKLKPADIFNMVQFSDTFTIWDIPNESKVMFTEETYGSKLEGKFVPPDAEATEENIRKAASMVDDLRVAGLTNIMGALEDAIYLAKRNTEADNNYYQPVVVLLTDGDPNVGLIATKDVVDRVLALNGGFNRAAIYCLSFGEDVEKDLLEKISLTNQGTFTHIYDEADSAVQLQEFYNEIASPMLKELTFDYGNGTVTDVTNTQFPMYFSGAEIAVAGVIDENQKENFRPVVKALGKSNAPFEFHPGHRTVVADLERLFAYLTLKQKIDLMKVASNASEIGEEVLAKSLQYSFVTPLTSLVIVKPDSGRSPASIADAWKKRAKAAPKPPPSNHPDVVSYDLAFNPDFTGNTLTSYQHNWLLNWAQDTTTTTTTQRPKTPMERIKENLPWIVGIMNEDDDIKIGQDWYRLELENPVAWKMVCMNPMTANGSSTTSAIAGRCRSLNDCPETVTIATSVEKFSEHFCPLNDIAGICCSR